MSRRAATAILVSALFFGWGAVSWAEVEQAGNLRVTFNADFAPRELPRHRPAPVRVEIHGAIATTDGSHPPPLRWLEVAIHRNGRLFSKGLPVCLASLLQSTSSRSALKRCRGARVGRGSFRAAVALGGGREIAATGRILAFNSRRAGQPALLLHLFAAVPVRFTLVVPLRIGHRDEGQFTTVLRARVPKLGGGLGSVTRIDLEIRRRYSFGGKRRSYLSAACSAPAGFPGAVFSFARGSFRFEGHREIATTLVRDCIVR
jgi:hypothetical protein